jgi:signal transduction histidine kinase
VEAAGLQISWPVGEESNNTLLAYGTYKNLISTFREIISNALKHAQASEIRVLVKSRGDRLDIAISDNGIGLPPSEFSRTATGLGLSSMGQRMAGIGGRLSLLTDSPGTTVRLEFPIPPVVANSFGG